MNLYEQQALNRRRTWLVMALFIGLLLIIGMGFDLFVVGAGQTLVPIGSVAALALGGGQAWWSLRFGDRAVLASSGAKPIEELLANQPAEDAKLRYTQLQNVVQEMAIAAGVPTPSIYVIPDPDPNAFATGRDTTHASIAVTDGLLNALDRDELQGVVAHEMSHVRNLDIRLMTVVAALVGALVLLSDWTSRSWRFGGVRRSSSRDRDDKGGGAIAIAFFVLWIVAAILAPLLGQLLAMAVSRRREYLADASGAELTRNPLELASALEKIDAAVEPTASIKRGTAHLCIADPMGRALNEREGGWSNLWATHPPIGKRIEALKAMAFQGGPSPAGNRPAAGATR
jgi:heat shock protein HtpX